tara:strand:- start:2311 stop:3249 length:939 start_codon:yes stop_codon:yes gene_type:complete
MTHKILITGGGGFIGTNLYNELTSRGNKVIRSDYYNSYKSNYCRCDVSNIRQLEEIFKRYGKFDYVYHLAAEYGRWNGEDFYENLWITNAIGTKNIIRIQEREKFKLIFFSSAEVYGDFEGDMSEKVMIDNPINETYQMNDYAISKWAGELMCQNSIKMFNTETVIVRPVNCYGPHEHYTPYRGFIPKFIFLLLNNQNIVVHKGHKRIIDYVEDTCTTFANITDNFISGEAYNVGGKIEWQMSVEEYAKIILKNLKKPIDLVQFHESENNTTMQKQMNFSKAINDLNHNPLVDPEKGIYLTAKWMKEFYKIT